MRIYQLTYERIRTGGSTPACFYYTMDKNLYLKSGYLNIPYILRFPVPFIFCVGGRGTGKTYGALKYVLESGEKFIYMRRTQSQSDLINKPDFSPFKSVARDMGIDIISEPVTKYNAAFYRGTRADDKVVPDGAPIGYTLALSTVSNLRGFDMTDCTLLIYDEFIPEKHERPLKNEAAALFNAYETINRNRELSGSAPLKVLCLANANDINNPIFAELGIVDKVYSMQRKKQTVSINEPRGYAVVLLSDSPISDRKRETALYKLTSGSDFEEMAIDNSYGVDFERRKNINLLEYIPLCTVEGITIYKHKSETRYYCTTHRSGGVENLDIRLYKKRYAALLAECDARGLVQYESLAIRLFLLNI